MLLGRTCGPTWALSRVGFSGASGGLSAFECVEAWDVLTLGPERGRLSADAARAWRGTELRSQRRARRRYEGIYGADTIAPLSFWTHLTDYTEGLRSLRDKYRCFGLWKC